MLDAAGLAAADADARLQKRIIRYALKYDIRTSTWYFVQIHLPSAVLHSEYTSYRCNSLLKERVNALTTIS